MAVYWYTFIYVMKQHIDCLEITIFMCQILKMHFNFECQVCIKYLVLFALLFFLFF